MKPNVVIMSNYYSKQSSSTKYSNKRSFYSSNQLHDYIGYIDLGANDTTKKVVEQGFDYIAYAGNKEKSSGVFNRDGLIDSSEKKRLRELLRNTDSVIWDLVISFEEVFGKAHIKSYKDALELVKSELPHFLKLNKLNYDNVYWFAGLHENTDNRHIHLSFFELKPSRLMVNKQGTFYHHGKLSLISINDFKVRIEERLTSPEYRLSQYRRNIVDKAKREVNYMSEYIDYEVELRNKLLELRRYIPKGKYGYNNKELDIVRPKLKECITYMFNANPDMKNEFIGLCNELHSHDEFMASICERDGIDPKVYMLEDKLIDDVYRRTGNVILSFLADYELEDIKNYSKGRKIREKNKINHLLKQTSRLTKNVNFEAINTFEDFKRRLKKAEEDIKKEKGEIEVE